MPSLKNIQMLNNVPCHLQEKCSTLHPLTNSLLRRQTLSVQSWVPSWPPQDSCTWHGRMVWMFVMQAGWQIVAFVTPSTSPDLSVEVACWECAPSICFPIRLAILSQTPAMMHFATLVKNYLLFSDSFFIIYDCLSTYIYAIWLFYPCWSTIMCV